MTISTVLAKFKDNLWGYHLPITEEQAKPFTGDNRRVKCIINDKRVLHCALMPKGGNYFILMNQANVKRLHLTEGSIVKVNIEKDNSEYGMPMPDSFAAILSQDEMGARYFNALTPGKQRTLIYLVSKVKNIDSQISKALAILDHLSETHGNLDFKRLNEKIKEYNQMRKLKR